VEGIEVATVNAPMDLSNSLLLILVIFNVWS